MLTQHFHGDGALTGDDLGVVKRVNESQALFVPQLDRKRVGVRIAVAVQLHFGAQRFHRVNFQTRGGHRHDDNGACAQFFRAQRHALRVVTGGGTDHAFFQLFRAELHHFIERTAQLEAEHRLLVFALEQHLVFDFFAEYGGRVQRGLVSHVVDAGSEYFFQIISRREFALARGGHGLGGSRGRLGSGSLCHGSHSQVRLRLSRK